MLSYGVCSPKCGEVAVGSGCLPLNPSSVTPAAPPLSAANSFPPACLFVFFLGKNQLKKKKPDFSNFFLSHRRGGGEARQGGAEGMHGPRSPAGRRNPPK